MKKLFAMLLALCMMCSVLPAFAAGGVTVSAGSMVFELPAGSTIRSQKSAGAGANVFEAKVPGRSIMGETVNYDLTGLVYYYDEADRSEQGVMDYQNFYILTALLFGRNNIDVMSPMDSYAEMPDGQPLMIGFASSGNKTITAVSHYYDGVGYMLVLSATDGDFVSYTLMQAAQDIAKNAKSAADLADGEALGTIVITNGSANIRSAPDGSARKILSALKGDTFPWLGEENGWYKIMVNGQIGYVSKSLSAVQ